MPSSSGWSLSWSLLNTLSDFFVNPQSQLSSADSCGMIPWNREGVQLLCGSFVMPRHFSGSFFDSFRQRVERLRWQLFMDWMNSPWGLKIPNSCKVAQVMWGLLLPAWLNRCNKMWNLFLVLLCSARECWEEGGPHVQEQERKWAEHVKPLLLGCRPQRWEKFAVRVCAVITFYFLAPWDTWWLLIPGQCGDPAFKEDVLPLSRAASLRACICLCVCVRERYSAPSAQRPQQCCARLFFPSRAVWRSKLFWAVLCHQNCSTVECEKEPTARGFCLILGSSWGLCLLG